MKVVALVSGGKDSCYAMQRCVDFGHQVSANQKLASGNQNANHVSVFQMCVRIY